MIWAPHGIKPITHYVLDRSPSAVQRGRFKSIGLEHRKGQKKNSIDGSYVFD